MPLWVNNGHNLDMRESQQALELRKFFAPGSSTDSSVQSSFNASLNYDGALDAYAETLVWRLNAARAMVSLIDRGMLWVVRANQNDLSQDADCEMVSTGQEWYGCQTVPTPGGLCENTLSVDLENDEYPCFIVCDLTKDPRFANIPIVDGRIASYRFYAGAPIVTSYGISIGSLFIFDDKARDGLTTRQKKFMHQQATNVMKHLEKKREAAEGRRGALMSQGLARFLERTSRENDPPNVVPIRNEDQKDYGKSLEGQAEISEMTSSQPPPLPNREKQDFDTNSATLDMINVTLNRAAETLRESLELESGGVAFLDAAVGYSELDEMGDLEISGKESKGIFKRDVIEHSVIPSSNANDEKPSLKVPYCHKRNSSIGCRKAGGKRKSPKVLAMSTGKDVTWDSEVKAMDTQVLHNLTKSYPKGNVWYLDENGYFSSLEQLQARSTESPGRFESRITSFDLSAQRLEAAILSRIFIKARQVVFVPLWDASADRWYAGCFVWSKSAVPVFTFDLETAYLSAFTNSMMVEISRLDVVSSDKTKSDFISSISHEFRSPLHGIIASAEFLRESPLDASQHEFISTIYNCSETLLDTINHVLDYSKINSFEKKKNKSGNISNELFRSTDLALLCEDIIHGMMAANEFRASGWQDLSLPYYSHFSPRNHQPTNHKPQSRLEIIMDFENRDWVYKVQAGALRRIVMNIFGNAQKYTDSGCIMIQLSMKDTEDGKDSSPGILCIRVRDTGRGMSSEYMDRKLYHPFAQEDSFAPGIGLGLSIVWSIVNQLGGEISIRSEIGKGTDVDIKIPVEKSERLQPQSGTFEQQEIAISDAEKALLKLRDQCQGKSISLIKQSTNLTRYKEILWQCIEKYCCNWFGFRIVNSSADILITDDITKLSPPISDRVLVTNEGMASPQYSEKFPIPGIIGSVSQPLGPYKLARSLLALLDKDISDVSSLHRLSSLANASTQTPVGSPAERAIMNGIIMMDYGFPQQPPLSENFATNISGTSGEEDITSHELTTETDTELPEKKQDQNSILSVLSSQNTLKLKSPPVKKQLQTNYSEAPSYPEHSVLDSNSNGQTAELSSNSYLTPCTVPAANRGLSILVVDDNALNLQLLKRYLLKREYDTIVTARNGFEAIASFKERGHFDVVFMDISMPEMSGFVATRRIRAFERSMGKKITQIKWTQEDEDAWENEIESEALEILEKSEIPETRHKRAYIVAVTGLASRRDREEAERSGLDDFLTKPISFTQIGVLLEKFCEDK